MKSEWYIDWFDSPYYHVLYKNRDGIEAEKFIHALNQFLAPKTDAIFLDAACGKGRHSIFIESLGYTIDGFDLSENSIEAAKNHETEKLKFFVNDIRIPLKVIHYDFVFNLFTSFGYFESHEDNQKAINALTESLKTNGVLVMDFMNCSKVIDRLNVNETKEIDDISFKINRSYKDGKILKDIEFEADNKNYKFQESVMTITLNDFKTYFEKANLKIEAIFGDYNLNPFDIEASDRLILIARKN